MHVQIDLQSHQTKGEARTTAKRTIIRISRTNEFNTYWLLLYIFQILLLVGTAYTYPTIQGIILTSIGLLIVIILALLYQGFEIIEAD